MKCNECGRMFLDKKTLDDHKKKEHEKPRLFYYKIARIPWPCQAVEEVGELLKVKVFNDDETEITVDVTKLKKFEKVKSIPKGRTAEWRRGYEKAITLMN